MQIKGGQIASFAAKPTVKRVLVFGPDRGQARMLSAKILAGFSPEAACFDGDALAGQADRLAEAMASTAGLFGPAKAVRVRSAADRSTKILKEILASPSSQAAIVVEAGELTASSSLRKLFEGAADAAAIACYPPEGARRTAWIASELALGKAKADAEASALLDLWLPGDSMLAASEIAKLAVYAGEGGVLRAADVKSLLADFGDADLDDAVSGCVEGDAAGALRALRRMPGFAAVGLLRSLQRHLQRLLSAKAAVEGGASSDDAMRALRPPVFFKETERFRSQLGTWTSARLERALGRAIEAEQQSKRTGFPDETLCAQLLLDLAFETAAERGGRKP